MSYRCDICGIKVPPRQIPLLHLTFYPNTRQIKRELRCCDGCHLMLDEVPLKSVKNPYYLRAKRGATTSLLVEHQPAVPPSTEDIGRPTKTTEL